MEAEERRYMERIERFTEEFARIQRDFVRDKEGVRAVAGLFREFGHAHSSPPDDPLLEKGKEATERAIVELGVELEKLRDIGVPPAWAIFHGRLLESLRLQLEGYHVMARVFGDWKQEHLTAGQELVRRGMALLEAGTPREGDR